MTRCKDCEKTPALPVYMCDTCMALVEADCNAKTPEQQPRPTLIFDVQECIHTIRIQHE